MRTFFVCLVFIGVLSTVHAADISYDPTTGRFTGQLSADEKAVLEHWVTNRSYMKMTERDWIGRALDNLLKPMIGQMKEEAGRAAADDMKRLDAELGPGRVEAIIQGTAVPPPSAEERRRVMEVLKRVRGQK